MPRSVMTWLLSILLGIGLAVPGVAVAADHHAGNACAVESDRISVSSSAELVAADTHDGTMICSVPCENCTAVMLFTRTLSAVSLPPALARSTV